MVADTNGQSNYNPIYTGKFGEGVGAGGVLSVAVDERNDGVLIGASDGQVGDFFVGSLSALVKIVEKRDS
jgi:hypothetical protein